MLLNLFLLTSKTFSCVASTYGSTVLRFYGSTVLRFYGSTVLRFYRSTVLPFYGSTVLRFYGSTVLRFYGSTVLRFYGSTVLSKCNHSLTEDRTQLLGAIGLLLVPFALAWLYGLPLVTLASQDTTLATP